MKIFSQFKKTAFFSAALLFIISCGPATIYTSEPECQGSTDNNQLLTRNLSDYEVNINSYNIKNQKVTIFESTQAYVIDDLPGGDLIDASQFYFEFDSVFDPLTKEVSLVSLFIKNANACVPFSIHSVQSFVSFNIQSNNEVSGIDAGQSINSEFNYSSDIYELRSALNEDTSLDTLDEFLQKDLTPLNFLLQFNGDVESGSTHTFQINMELDTGEIIEVFSDPVTFN